MHGSCKIALFMVLLSDVDCDILLLPVRVRHVKNARTWLRTLLLYTLLHRISFKAITFSTSRACFIDVHVCSGKIHFYDLQKFTLETCSEKLEIDIMMPSLSDYYYFIIIVAKNKVTLSHKNVAGALYQVFVASRALVKCQLYSSSSSSTGRPMFSRLEKTHWTAATSDCAGMSDNDDRDLTDVCNEFQVRAAATRNARLPNVARRDGGTIRLDVDPDRRRRRDSTSDVRCSVSERYDGALPWRQR